MNTLPIRSRMHVDARGATSVVQAVRCPDDASWRSIGACRSCSRCRAIEATAVTCDPAGRTPDRRAADRAPVAEVMDAVVLCADADAPVDAVRAAMLEHDAPVAVVVDADGHPIGVCSRTDLAERSPSRRVATCMTPFAITLLDSSSVADALALVVERDLHHVPVVSRGRVVGLVTPRAVMRWLAHGLRAASKARAPSPGRRAKRPKTPLAGRLLSSRS